MDKKNTPLYLKNIVNVAMIFLKKETVCEKNASDITSLNEINSGVQNGSMDNRLYARLQL